MYPSSTEVLSVPAKCNAPFSLAFGEGDGIYFSVHEQITRCQNSTAREKLLDTVAVFV
jgi:hypothetical protein